MRPTSSLRTFFFVFASGLLFSTSGADWPQWQGPHRDGKSGDAGLLQEWPAGGPRLVWKAKELGGGYTAPSVAEGKIFGMGYLDNDEVVWALEETTGKMIWKTKTGVADRKIGYPDGPRSTPTVDGERMYTLSPSGRILCLKAATGELLWQKNFEDFGGQMMSDWGYSESPLVDGDRVVCTPGGQKGTMLALNKITGEPLWQSSEIKDKAAYCSIQKASIEGVDQYIQLTDASVFAVRPEDGKLLWRARRPGRTAVIPTAVVDGNLVYVTSGYAVGCNLFRIEKAGDAFHAEQVYANKVMKNHHGGVVLLDGNIYGFSDGNGWVCQNFKTGAPIWEEKSKLGKGSISYADHRLYLRFETGPGTVVLLEPSTEGYVSKGQFNQPDRSDKNSWPHPVIANGRLYLRDQGVLLCYDVSAK